MAEVRYADDATVHSALRALVTSARSIAQRQFMPSEYPRFDFDSARWDLNRSDVQWQTHRVYAHFFEASINEIRSEAKRESAARIDDSYASVVKAWLIHTDRQPANISACAGAARSLWHGLKATRFSEAGSFRWDRLSSDDLSAAADVLSGRRLKSARNAQNNWAQMLGWLVANEILPDGFEWRPSAPVRAHDLKYREERLQKLPERAVLEALAEIYTIHAVERDERLVICAIGLLLVCGFRLSELLTLPNDCWVSSRLKGRTRFGIRYWNRKTPDGAYKHAIRWLSPLGAELATRCLSEIRQLTALPRKQAKVLETSKWVTIPWFGQRTWLSREESAFALNVAPPSISALIRSGSLRLLPVLFGPHKGFFRRCDIEAELWRRQPPLRTLQISGRKFQKLSDTLLITFVGGSEEAASELLVTSLSASAVNVFMGSAEPRSPSAFTRYGLNAGRDRDSLSPMRLHTHMIRHWLNTVANRAGMSAFQITLWMGRSSVLESKVYLHDSLDIADLSRELLRQSRMRGQRADEYAALPPSDKEPYLSVLRHGHRASAGLCVEPYVSGCRVHKTCDFDCRSFLAVVGDPSVLSELELRHSNYEAAMEAVQAVRREGRKVIERQPHLWRRGIEMVDALIRTAKEDSPNAS